MTLRIGIIAVTGLAPFRARLSEVLEFVRTTVDRVLREAKDELDRTDDGPKRTILERRPLVLVIAEDESSPRAGWIELARGVSAELWEISANDPLGAGRDAKGSPSAEQLVADQSDLLLVLGDTSTSAHVAEVVRTARDAQIGVVPISRDGELVDHVAVEAPASGTRGPDPAAAIEQVVRQLLFPFQEGARAETPGGNQRALTELRDFLNEPSPSRKWWRWQSLRARVLSALWLMVAGRLDLREDTLPKSAHYVQLASAIGGLAGYYQGLYRGAFICNYLLGGLAVTLALLELVADRHEVVAMVLSGVELLAVGIIISVYWSGKRGRWHERAVTYRALAEHFRMMYFLEPLGLGVPHSGQLAHTPKHLDLATSWAIWYFRCVVRAMPLPTHPPISGAAAAWRRAKELRDNWLAAQSDYHAANSERMTRAVRRCESVTTSLFWFTLGCGLIHLALGIARVHLPDWLPPWFVLVAAGLPAWGGALHAIKVQGEFERLGERSKAMAHRMRPYLEDLDKTLAAGSPEGVVDLTKLRQIAWAAAGDMAIEVRDWHTLYLAHPIPVS